MSRRLHGGGPTESTERVSIDCPEDELQTRAVATRFHTNGDYCTMQKSEVYLILGDGVGLRLEALTLAGIQHDNIGWRIGLQRVICHHLPVIEHAAANI